ncbi:MAG: hypothetical protein ACI92S_000365, partial [Planctomycetaceae bacterium]
RTSRIVMTIDSLITIFSLFFRDRTNMAVSSRQLAYLSACQRLTKVCSRLANFVPKLLRVFQNVKRRFEKSSFPYEFKFLTA